MEHKDYTIKHHKIEIITILKYLALCLREIFASLHITRTLHHTSNCQLFFIQASSQVFNESAIYPNHMRT